MWIFFNNNDRQKEKYHSRNTCSSFLIKMADTIQSKQFGHKWKWILMSANIIEIYMKSIADNRKNIYTVWLKSEEFLNISLCDIKYLFLQLWNIQEIIFFVDQLSKDVPKKIYFQHIVNVRSIYSRVNMYMYSPWWNVYLASFIFLLEIRLAK